MSEAEPQLRDLLPYLLQRASFLVTRAFHRQLQLSGVSVSRWRMLAWLSEHEPYSVSELAEQLMLRQPTVTRLVRDAVADGLVLKTPDPADARRAQIRLTPGGRRLVASLWRQARAAEAAIIADHGPEHTAAVKDALRRLIDDAEKP